MKKQVPEKNNPNKEKLTSEQIWKNASKILGAKRRESLEVNTHEKSINFADIDTKLQEITNHITHTLHNQSRERFMKCELENSLFHRPTNISKIEYKPTRPCEVPSFFPKLPLNIFEDPEIYKKLDINTLFYIFYKNPNSVAQYYAASQLKLYSWRFHTKYLTWFQRLDEPKLITLDYERGDFLFFDFDVTWSCMKKNDFTFEYKYLECSDL